MVKKPKVDKKKTESKCARGRSSRIMDHNQVVPPSLPMVFCVVMYAQYVCRRLVGTETEAELLVELLTSWTVKMRSSPDSFDSVRELGR